MLLVWGFEKELEKKKREKHQKLTFSSSSLHFHHLNKKTPTVPARVPLDLPLGVAREVGGAAGGRHVFFSSFFFFFSTLDGGNSHQNSSLSTLLFSHFETTNKTSLSLNRHVRRQVLEDHKSSETPSLSLFLRLLGERVKGERNERAGGGKRGVVFWSASGHLHLSPFSLSFSSRTRVCRVF